MQIRVCGWSYENIRGGLRQLRIDLGNDANQKTLIQMPNGTGKTTTMRLFRALLTEERLTSELVRSLRASDADNYGNFELRLEIGSVPYRLVLRLNYLNGTAVYFTSRASVQSGGLDRGILLPEELKRLLTPDFARLFIFDGELASQIRDISQQRATEAIGTLYRLTRLDDLLAQIDRLVADAQNRAEGSRAMEARGVTRLRNSVQEAQDAVSRLREKLESARSQSQLCENRRQDLEAQKMARVERSEEIRVAMQRISGETQTVDADIMESTKRILAEMRNPAALSEKMDMRVRALGNKLERLKLPRSMSVEFFHELAEAPECVCGRAIAEKERLAILHRSSEYLAENQIAVINSMKASVRMSDADPRVVAEQVKELRELLRRRVDLTQRQDKLTADSVRAGDSELEEILRQLSKLETEASRLSRDIEELGSTDAAVIARLGLDWQKNLPLAEQELRSRESKLATATETRRFFLQSNETKDLIKSIRRVALDRLRERVRLSTNEKLRDLVQPELIEVSRIDGALVLTSGGLSIKAGVSEGQSLAVAYAFLTSLFQDAPFDLPFVVDSPAVSLDTRVRREVGRVLPNLFRQLIAFVISSEREGFAQAFYGRSDTEFITIWREQDGSTEVRAGISAFQSFHGEDEEARGGMDS